MPRMKHILHCLALSLTFLLASCNQYSMVTKSTDYDYKYEVAKQCYAAGQYNRAANILQDVIAMYKGTDKGEESLFLLGLSSFKARNYDAASAYLKRYYQSYPKGTYAERARFYSGLALYESTPEVRLDQSGTYAAVTEFSNYLELYPAGEYSKEAQRLIFEMQDKLVEKEYLSAKLYYDLGSYFGNCTNGGSNYQACIVTAQNAIKDYPYTSHREAFAILILRAKFTLAAQSVEEKKVERYQDAIDEYYGFTTEYPESQYMKEAKQLFAKASKYVKTTDGTDDDGSSSSSDAKTE